MSDLQKQVKAIAVFEKKGHQIDNERFALRNFFSWKFREILYRDRHNTWEIKAGQRRLLLTVYHFRKYTEAVPGKAHEYTAEARVQQICWFATSSLRSNKEFHIVACHLQEIAKLSQTPEVFSTYIHPRAQNLIKDQSFIRLNWLSI